MKRKTITLAALLLFLAAELRGETIIGKVSDAKGNAATITVQSDLMPVVGDSVTIYFKLPGIDEEVLVGTGKVTTVAGDRVTATIDNLKGTLQKNQFARIDAKNTQPKSSPKALTEPPLSPSPVSSPPATAATPAPMTAESRFAGDWSAVDPNASYTMKLTQQGNRVTGQYGLQGGEIAGEVKGATLVMTWKQTENRRGGSATLKLSADGQTLSGQWEYDPKVFESGLTGGGTWTFRRRTTAPPSATVSPARAPVYTPPPYTPKLGVAASYSCDDGSGDTLTDNSNNGRPMKLYGGLGFTSGKQGQALDFKNSAKFYASREKDDTILNFADRDFTIELSANFRGFAHEQVLLEKFSGKAGPGWTLTVLNQTKLHFFTQGAGSFTAKVDLKPNEWYRFAVARRGSRLQILVDDAAVLDEAIAGSVVPSPNPLLLGRRNDQDGRGFPVNGLIDEVRIEVVPPRRE